MSPIRPEKALSPYLGIIIRPNFLAAVCCLDEVLSDSSLLSHFLGKFLVHQTRCKHLEGSPFVLDMDISIDMKRNQTSHAYLMLRPLILHGNGYTSWYVGQTHGGLCFIYVL